MSERESVVPLLEGIRALEIARLIPGPYLGMLLADLGADVAKVEDTQHGDYFRLGSDGKNDAILRLGQPGQAQRGRRFSQARGA